MTKPKLSYRWHDGSTGQTWKPKPKPAKPRKRRAAKVTKEWGVWIPRESENGAKLLIVMGVLRHPAFKYAEIRRLPRRKADGGGRR